MRVGCWIRTRTDRFPDLDARTPGADSVGSDVTETGSVCVRPGPTGTGPTGSKRNVLFWDVGGFSQTNFIYKALYRQELELKELQGIKMMSCWF